MCEQMGLYKKYIVQKVEGETDPNADYFVMRVDTDPVARMALLVYAKYIYTKNPKLAQELIDKVKSYGTIVCSECDGTGTVLASIFLSNFKVKICENCNGEGVVKVVRSDS